MSSNSELMSFLENSFDSSMDLPKSSINELESHVILKLKKEYILVYKVILDSFIKSLSKIDDSTYWELKKNLNGELDLSMINEKIDKKVESDLSFLLNLLNLLDSDIYDSDEFLISIEDIKNYIEIKNYSYNDLLFLDYLSQIKIGEEFNIELFEILIYKYSNFNIKSIPVGIKLLFRLILPDFESYKNNKKYNKSSNFDLYCKYYRVDNLDFIMSDFDYVSVAIALIYRYYHSEVDMQNGCIRMSTIKGWIQRSKVVKKTDNYLLYKINKLAFDLVEAYELYDIYLNEVINQVISYYELLGKLIKNDILSTDDDPVYEFHLTHADYNDFRNYLNVYREIYDYEAVNDLEGKIYCAKPKVKETIIKN